MWHLDYTHRIPKECGEQETYWIHCRKCGMISLIGAEVCMVLINDGVFLSQHNHEIHNVIL